MKAKVYLRLARDSKGTIIPDASMEENWEQLRESVGMFKSIALPTYRMAIDIDVPDSEFKGDKTTANVMFQDETKKVDVIEPRRAKRGD